MQIRFVYKKGNPRLLLIFAGWGMDYRPFENLTHEAYDIAVAWDYRDLPQAIQCIENYCEVSIIAWSFGVYCAQQLLHMLGTKKGRSIAVNGTPKPIDDLKGIPVSLFHATLNNFNKQNLDKFYRRMCGGFGPLFDTFIGCKPQRDLQELKEELQTIYESAAFATTNPTEGLWDLAILGSEDAIFPIANQRNAWEPLIPVVELKIPHLPPFQELINQFLINKPLVSHRFSEASDTYIKHATVQSMVAHDLWNAICRHNGHKDLEKASRIIEVGSGTGIFTEKYTSFVNASDWQLWDIADVPDWAIPNGAMFLKIDAEMAIREEKDNSIDAIVSSCALQWLSSPMRFIQECQRALKPGGLFAFSTFDNDNMHELRLLAPNNSLAVPSKKAWESCLTKHFDILEVNKNPYCMLFESPRQVLQHLKLTGVNSVSQNTTGGASIVRHILDNYPRTSTPQARCALTYTPLIFIVKKKTT